MGELSAPGSRGAAAPFPSAAMLTLSFAGDHERCRVLCETADRFVPASVEHVLAVPSADLALFRPLGGGRRRLVAQEELLPSWLMRLPMPGPPWRQWLRLPRRNVYLSLRGMPVRGWIAQQIMKIVGAARAGVDIVLHCDSDSAFVRPLTAAHLGRDGRVRLLRVPGAGDTPMHAPWHETASRLLGLPPSRYHGADYIENFVTWRQPIVAGLLARIEEVAGRDPVAALAGTRHLSEYILYGAYCDKLLGLEAAGHVAEPTGLCATLFVPPGTGSPGGAAIRVAPGQVGIGIQSTIPMAPEDYRGAVEATIRRAASEDRACG